MDYDVYTQTITDPALVTKQPWDKRIVKVDSEGRFPNPKTTGRINEVVEFVLQGRLDVSPLVVDWEVDSDNRHILVVLEGGRDGEKYSLIWRYTTADSQSFQCLLDVQVSD